MLPLVLRAAAIVLALAAALPRPALAGPAGDTAEDARRAVTSAGNAFEYRDFKRVIDVLGPWVHPPRIADAGVMKEARRLLGISLHIQGDPAAAREEFANILIADPELKLDPFVVPPAVIESFESVRASMRPVLDRLLAARGATPQPPEDPPASAALPHPLVAYAPLGLGQLLALDEPEWGAFWLTLQTVGLAANVSGFWLARGVAPSGILPADQVDQRDQLLALQYGGIALFALAWVGSIIEGNVALARRRDLILGGAPGRTGLARSGVSIDLAAPGATFGARLSVPF